MTELYITERRMELDGETVIARTFQQNLITSQGTVDNPYTNSFSLPWTKNNAAVLGSPEEATSLTPTPYVKLDCVIIQDGIEQFPNSIAEVQGFDEGRYTVQVFAGAIPFFDLLGDSNIQDLDFNQYRHLWNYANVVAGLQGVDGVYIYDLVDRGKPLEQIRLHASYLMPSVFAKAIWNKIFATVGVPCNVGQNTDFDALTVPFSNAEPLHTESWIAQNTISAGLSSHEGWFNAIEIPVPTHGELSVEIKVTFSRIDEPIDVYFSLRRGGRYLPNITKRTEFSATGENIYTASHTIEAGTDLEGLMVLVNLENPNGRYVMESNSVTFSYGPEAVYGTEWDISLNLPNMKQKDFVLAICKLFGWGLVYDAYAGSIEVKPLSDTGKNIAAAKDWTRKLDYANLPKVAYKLPETARENLYTWKEDETVPAGLGDGVLFASNEHLEAERQAVEMPFAASEMVNGLVKIGAATRNNPIFKTAHSQTVAVYADLAALGRPADGYTVLVTDATGDNTVANGSAIYTFTRDFLNAFVEGWQKVEQEAYDNEKSEPRLLSLWEGSNKAILLTDGTSSQLASVLVPNFAPLHFAALIPKYYSVLSRILERVQMATVPVLLTAQDFAELDSTVPVWVDQFQDYYYLNKVTDYTSETQPCEAELIKLN